MLNHDKVLSYLLEGLGFDQSSPFVKTEQATRVENNECIALVKTYRGDLPELVVDSLYAALKQPSLERIEIKDIDQTLCQCQGLGREWALSVASNQNGTLSLD